MKCGACGYDMSGTSNAAQCPECGVVEWRRQPEGFSAAEWWGFGIATVPLAAVGVVHLLYVVAWGVLGRRPVPYMDDPAGVAYVGTACEWTLMVYLLGLPISFVSILCLASVMHFNRRLGWQTIQFVAIAAVLWGAGLALGQWDPVGAVRWLMD